MLESCTIETFSDQLNTKFRLRLDDANTLELELTEVKDLGSSPEHEQFSLIFRGPVDGPLYQYIFRVEHDKIGALDLFLVPIGRDQNGMRYEAVVNRLKT
jgi:uncharacterized protein DUF6916